jgi:vitamin B12 transporter
MNKNFPTICLPFIFPMLLFFSCTCWAQSDEEMQFLHMFYKDKDLVVSSTRNEKNISQVAENITVITSEDIENMNAHTVADVLIRVPGVFVSSNQDFAGASILAIQGSETRHVLVLVDEMPWNLISAGTSETSSIPIGAVERIEIIKGPASSAWGSSLGGVINIITKKTGTSERPAGSISASYGKSESQDYRAEISGKAGALGYYLYAGDQTSDGIISARYMDGKKFFSKLNMPIAKKGELGLEIGYSSSKIGFGDFPSNDMYSSSGNRTFYGKGTFKLSVAEGFDLKLSLFDMLNNSPLDNRALGLGMFGPRGTLIQKDIYDEERIGVRSQLVYTTKAQTAVLGIDYDDGKVEQTTFVGPVPQMAFGAPAKAVFAPEMKQWALYVNDSITTGNLSITPGIRYDHDSNTGSFVSPSLGSTYKLSKDTVLRGSISRGFNSPALSEVSGGGLFVDPNPSIQPEKIWAYQAGMESSAIPYIWTKITLFRDRIEDIHVLTYSPPPSSKKIVINGGKSTRQGFEVEAASIPIHNISLSTGYSYADISPANEDGASNMYTIDMGVIYNADSIHVQLNGRYRRWDMNPSEYSKDDDFIWDLNISKKIVSYHSVTPELFFTAHNLFNGLQYVDSSKINPGRWLEAGVKFHF